MKKSGLLVALVLAACNAPPSEEVSRWEAQAANVTITRDDWGIAHIHGKTDADAVFGMVYAQAEDDFNRIERNFLNSTGRLAEAEGDSAIWADLRMRLFIDPDSMRAMYTQAPEWLRKLMDAWADGLNYYLHTHPDVKPRALAKFEPWMALTFSEGSIGGDIESTVGLSALRTFYDSAATAPVATSAAGGDGEPRGSNGIAIAPSNTTNGKALLLINPHTSFFFRSELHMSSDEGLNAYGAVTWGQFFVYQGFNQHAGWMHTSSGVDNTDEFTETVVQRDGRFFYRYGSEERPVGVDTITISYRSGNGLATRDFVVYRTHHGPIVRQADGKWIAMSLMNTPLTALTQSYARTKATDLESFIETMRLHTNSSNNTLYADRHGNIAYFHANFIPKRNAALDWSKPIDGSVPANDWQGVHTFEEAPNVINPSNGWVYNTNNWPYSAAGPNSPKPSAYPRYVDENPENARGLHAIRVLQNRKDFTLDGLVTAAYDSYLTAFEILLPPLVASYDRTPASDAAKGAVAEQIEMLRKWDMRWSASSIETSLAVFWAEELARMIGRDATTARVPVDTFMKYNATPAQRLTALAAASDTLAARFGSWKTPWGDINRFQRVSPEIVHPFDDAKPSIPVPFTSARWGSLASFGARTYKGSKKIYGTSGNSFVAVVEFGDSVRARAVTAGGESGDPNSPHFNDQAERYASGDLREVYFYPAQIQAHAKEIYRPGQRGN